MSGSLNIRLYQIHKELVCREALITPKHLLVKLFSKEERRTVLGTMRKYMKDWMALIGKEYQKSTLSRYGNCYESLKAVIHEFYKKEDISFNELNGEFIDAFEMHLRIVRQLSQNTLTKYMSCFRKIIGIARDNGWLTFDPLAGKRKRLFRKEETCPTFLTLEELQRIISKDFSTTRLEQVKDFFLFCCLTGMSYIDVSTLLPTHLCRDNKNQLWIHKSRVKVTAAKETCTSNVPLLAPAVDILDKYNIHATFYNLGQNIEAYPDIAKKVIDQGSEIQSHTYQHAQLTKLDASALQNEFSSAFQDIKDNAGTDTTAFRPPYGDFNENAWLNSGGLASVSVLWNQDSLDWKRPGADAIVQNSLKGITSGSIILMHDGGGNRDQDVEALPTIIETLQGEGYEFVTVTELMKSDSSIPEDIASGNATMPEGCVWPTEIKGDDDDATTAATTAAASGDGSGED